MLTHITTERLILEPLVLSDAKFILELVNTDAWIKFIGNRQINSLEDADRYIRKIIDNPSIQYWVVKLKEDRQSVGIITFIKRAYLMHHDIGFAFLPAYSKKGYAYEATATVLSHLLKEPAFSVILATTATDNINSIKLLEKLGLEFNQEMEVDSKTLQLYRISAG